MNRPGVPAPQPPAAPVKGRAQAQEFDRAPAGNHSPETPHAKLGAVPRVGRYRALAWLPIPGLLLLIVVLWAADLRGSYDSPLLVMFLDFLFTVLGSLFVAYMVACSFLGGGSPGLLLLCSGMLLWALGGELGTAVAGGDVNINVSIHNCCVWLSGLCHVSGVILLLNVQRRLRQRRLWLGVALALAAATVGLIAMATLRDWLPIFFVQGQGGTLVRQVVLGSAISLFVLTSSLLRVAHRPALSSFAFWYSLALLMIAAGLFGILLQSSRGSLLGWTGRTAQFGGGVYMFLAALALRRDSETLELSVRSVLQEGRYPYGVAIIMPVVAAALRLAFLQSLGMDAPYVTFYPAIIVAALYGGFRPGLMATVLSVLLIDYFWTEPVGHLFVNSMPEWLAMGVFLLGGTMISWITEALRRAQERTARAEAEARTAAERAATSEALRESQDQFRALIAASSDVLFRMNPDWSEMRQLRSGDFLTDSERPNSKWLQEHIYPDDHPHLRAAIDQAIRTKSLFELDHRVLRADGSVGWKFSRAIPLLSANGEILEWFGVASDITEHKRAEAALHAAHARTAAILEQMNDGFVTFDRNWCYTQVNAAAARAFQTTPEALLGKNLWELWPAAYELSLGMHFRRSVEQNIPLAFESFYPEPLNRWFECRCHPFREGLATFLSDITDRKQAEDELHMLNRTLRALSKANQALVHARVESEYLEAVCQIVVEDCGHAMVWVGYAEEDPGKTVRPVAHAGFEQGYLETLQLTWSDTDRGHGPTGTAIRTSQACRCNNILTDPRFQPWREEARKRGYASSMALPLLAQGKAFGALTIYSRKPDPFSEAEVRLLTELTDNLASGIEIIRTRLAHARAEEALRTSEAQLRTMADAMPQLAWIAHADGFIHWYNRGWYEYTGTTPEQMEGWGWQSVHDPQVLPQVLEQWRAAIAAGTPLEIVFPLRGADGTFRRFLTRVQPLKDAQGTVVQWFGTNTDVDQLKRAEERIQASLHEKEVLLKEIHHRVKNNLQVISSLVDLQADAVSDPALGAAFADVRDRVRSMALVHEKLYQSESLASVDFAEYTRSLLSYLWRAHGTHAVRLKLELQPTSLSVDTAVPCGLILNELAANSLKHAFRGRSEGEVTVALHTGPDGRVSLSVSDDGVGLPSGLDWRQCCSMGLGVVQMLVKQLNATVEVSNNSTGTQFQITFAPTRTQKNHP